LQIGVAPEQAGVGATSQVPLVQTLCWHLLAGAAQAEELLSLLAVVQALFVQTSFLQTGGVAVHWASAVHATHVPLDSLQYGVAPEQAGVGATPQVPLVQTLCWHLLAGAAQPEELLPLSAVVHV
jgi:hypothetical protein